MNAPIPLPWWTVLIAFAGVLVYVYVLGVNRMSAYQDERIEHAVNRAGTTGTAVRYLYALQGLPAPDLDERPEPEPVPSRWSRVRGWWERKTRPVESRTQDKEPNVAFELAPDDAPDTDEIPVQPGPATQPDMKVAHRIEPPRTLEQILAEFADARADVEAQRRELDAAEWRAG